MFPWQSNDFTCGARLRYVQGERQSSRTQTDEDVLSVLLNGHMFFRECNSEKIQSTERATQGSDHVFQAGELRGDLSLSDTNPLNWCKGRNEQKHRTGRTLLIQVQDLTNRACSATNSLKPEPTDFCGTKTLHLPWFRVKPNLQMLGAEVWEHGADRLTF